MPVALLIFIVVPVVEMYILIEVGAIIGAWPTIGLVLLTAMIGLALLRQQGFSTLARGMQRLDAGELPAEEMLEGLLLAVGGALLLTPGFVTDAFGFALLLPFSRRALARVLMRRGLIRMAGGSSAHGAWRHPDGSHVIEGEWMEEQPPSRRIDPDPQGPGEDDR